MNKQFLVNRGIESDMIKELIFGIDEISSGGFDAIEDFLFDYAFYPNVDDFNRDDVRYYILNGDNKTIKVLVWLEK